MKLVGVIVIALVVTVFADMLICGIKQILIELRGGYNTNTDGLYIILFLPLWIIISFIGYYILI